MSLTRCNFLNGRVHVQDNIYMRFALAPHEKKIILEDLTRAQVEPVDDSNAPCSGRIDIETAEVEQLWSSWNEIVTQFCLGGNKSMAIQESLQPPLVQSTEGGKMTFVLQKPFNRAVGSPPRPKRSVRIEVLTNDFPAKTVFSREEELPLGEDIFAALKQQCQPGKSGSRIKPNRVIHDDEDIAASSNGISVVANINIDKYEGWRQLNRIILSLKRMNELFFKK